MSDKPIIMSAPMVRALLEGRKTQTRRVLKPQPPKGHKLVGIYAPHLTAVFNPAGSEHYGNPDEDFSVLLPYRLKQRLWVPEEWGVGTRPDPFEGWRDGVEYRADEALLEDEHDDLPLCPVNPPDDVDLDEWSGKGWQSAESMPRWASRLTLIVTDARVERLEDISAEDIYAEGTPAAYDAWGKHSCLTACREGFAALWNSLHKPGFQFDDNPWVAVVSFETHHANIDELREAA